MSNVNVSGVEIALIHIMNVSEEQVWTDIKAQTYVKNKPKNKYRTIHVRNRHNHFKILQIP